MYKDISMGKVSTCNIATYDVQLTLQPLQWPQSCVCNRLDFPNVDHDGNVKMILFARFGKVPKCYIGQGVPIRYWQMISHKAVQKALLLGAAPGGTI